MHRRRPGDIDRPGVHELTRAGSPFDRLRASGFIELDERVADPNDSFAGVILAAGRSRRLGRPKQLVPFRGEPLVRRAARAAVEAGLDPVVVVVAPGADAVRAAVSGLRVEVVENAASAAGVGTSVACGVQRIRTSAPGAAGVVLVACDQPLVEATHLRSLVTARRSTGLPVVASEYGGVRGVPVLIGAEILDEVAALGADSGAREVVRRDPARVAAVPFAGGDLDIDVAADLERAREVENDGR